MRIIRLHVDEEGRSRFDDVDLPSEGTNEVLKTTYLPGTEGVFLRTLTAASNPGSEQFHTALRRQYAVNLSGKMEMWLKDGSRRLIVPGDIIMTEDTHGDGHAARTLGDEPRITLYLPMA